MAMQIPPIILSRNQAGLDVVDGRVFFLFLLFYSVFLIFVAYFADHILPSKYLYDSYNISTFMPQATNIIPKDSYNNTAYFYNLVNVRLEDRWYRAFAATLYILFVWIAIFVGRPQYFTRSASLITFAAMTSGMVYLAQLSKEFWVFLLIVLFFFCSVNRWLIAIWTIVALLYAYNFRGYWYLIVYMFVWLELMGHRARTPFQLILLIVSGLLVITIAHEIFNGGSILKHREGVNAFREGSADAQTLIKTTIPASNPIADWLNCCIVWFQMLIPYRLIMAGAAQHIASAIIMFTLFRMMFIGHANFQRQAVQDLRLFHCFALFMAFTSVQSVFEPDYGSMLKHMVPLIPLALAFATGLYRPDHVLLEDTTREYVRRA